MTRRTWSLVLAGGLLVVAVRADAAVVICSKKGKLTLRVDTCKGKETAVDAAQLGVTGPAGAKGDQGDAGLAGLSGVEVVTSQGTFTVTGTVIGTATASCPSGKTVIGGGGEFVPIVGTLTELRMLSSVPVTTAPQGWKHEILVTVNDDWGVRAHAICATVAP